MVRYKKPTQQRSHVEDRRGSPGRRAGGIAAGGGGLAVIIAIVVALLSGGEGGLEGLGPVLEQLAPPPQQGSSGPAPLDPATDPDADLFAYMTAVFTDAEDVWREIFDSAGLEYEPSSLIIFDASTGSACGGAFAQIGPHYCPLDQSVYLDLDFFDELADRFGAGGDFAPAYVVAHEVGHHVQNVLGIADEVRSRQEQNPSQANDYSIRMELQADCFAGVWASTLFVDPTGSETIEEGLIELDPGEIHEALEAAAAVGDDRIQEATTGRIDPEKFNHGTSAQRQEWFNRGYRTGDPNRCDTFSADL